MYNAQTVKFKNDDSCSTKMASSLRYKSFMIGKYVIHKANGVSSLNECAKMCFDKNACTNYGYQEVEVTCLLFKRSLVDETISRLLFTGWQYGRVTSTRKVDQPACITRKK